jgi:hypothetical protein
MPNLKASAAFFRQRQRLFLEFFCFCSRNGSCHGTLVCRGGLPTLDPEILDFGPVYVCLFLTDISADAVFPYGFRLIYKLFLQHHRPGDCQERPNSKLQSVARSFQSFAVGIVCVIRPVETKGNRGSHFLRTEEHPIERVFSFSWVDCQEGSFRLQNSRRAGTETGGSLHGRHHCFY